MTGDSVGDAPMNDGPKIERRYRGLSRKELGRLIRREAREALRIVTPETKPGAQAKRPGSGVSDGGVQSPSQRDDIAPDQSDVPDLSDDSSRGLNVRRVPKDTILKIPREPAELAKTLIAERESICARCEHFNGVCTLIFPQANGCRSLQRYRPGWLMFAAEAVNVCPVGRWFPDRG